MQETHPRIWELAHTSMAWVPAGTEISITDNIGEIVFMRLDTPVMWMKPRVALEPIHLGGCI